MDALSNNQFRAVIACDRLPPHLPCGQRRRGQGHLKRRPQAESRPPDHADLDGPAPGRWSGESIAKLVQDPGKEADRSVSPAFQALEITGRASGICRSPPREKQLIE